MSERDTLTSALAGPLVNARATSAGVAPWAPIPGSSSGACGSSRLASPTSRGWVAPTTAPTLERPQSPTSSSPQEATSSATWCQSGRPSESFRSWTSPAGVRGLEHAEDPRACPARAPVRNGSSDSRPRYVWTVMASPTGPSPFRGSRYAVAYARAVEPMSPRLRVDEDHEQAGRAGVRADILEAPCIPCEPSASKNAICGLTPTTYGRDRVDDAAAEARTRGRRLLAAPETLLRGARAGTARDVDRGRRGAGCACARPPRPADRRTTSSRSRPLLPSLPGWLMP